MSVERKDTAERHQQEHAERTEKSATASPSQLESSATREAPVRPLLDVVNEYGMACYSHGRRTGMNPMLPTSLEDRRRALWVEIKAALEAPDSRDVLRAKAAAYDRINTPEIDDFLSAVRNEALHQRERWGAAKDSGKEASDWFWLVGYLAGKALHDVKGKRLHHLITTAAALLNWHGQETGNYAVEAR